MGGGVTLAAGVVAVGIVCVVAAGGGAAAVLVVAVTVVPRMRRGLRRLNGVEVCGCSVVRATDGTASGAVAGVWAGARSLTTESGTDVSPIGCANSWLAPHVRPAVMAIPESAAATHPSDPRRIRPS